ncbi:autophagy-related protein 2 [Vermiconidia calcicola]|uniref:Autophagy-related protein 2 n=1 Tax=Vermiconidia calcicola TaxID=1690605 RepID=A0ACC3NUD0_9PEZI|nr:autophagy-related protein 2 [Vermiconidia calcicola]
MAWWQKKLLRYALSRTGLLDDTALDPNNLDIALGKKNVIELKDVGLNIKRISKLAQLPPGLRIETARVLSLRLVVPADIYQSSIVAEVDGVELSLRLEEKVDQDSAAKESKRGARSPVNARNPQHRKVHRRLHSPPPYDPGGLQDSGELHIPTTEELAKSFLLEEPAQERRELEASVAANAKGLEESIASESSESDDLGTGGTVGLPDFLAGFLQGIVDRLQVRIKNVNARLETEVPGDGFETVPLTLHLHVGYAELASATDVSSEQDKSRRRINLQDLSLNLVSDAAIFSDLSELPSHDSPAQSRQQGSDPSSPKSFSTDSARASGLSTHRSHSSHSSTKSSHPMQASVLTTADADRFADAGEHDEAFPLQKSHADLDIQPGDDNISWGSRRSESDAPAEDLWQSMASEDDLPDSLLLERAPTPRAPSSPNQTRTRRNVSPYARSLESPGSWPRLEEKRSQQSPGSCPTLDQSQQSLFQSLTYDQDVPAEGVTTANEQAGFGDASQRFRDASQRFGDVPQRSGDASQFDDSRSIPSNKALDDLAASRYFSNEEANSLYMSAMAYESKISRHVPGGWGLEPTPSEGSESSEDRHQYQASGKHVSPSKDAQFDDDLAYGGQPYSTPVAPLSGNVTPRARSPGPARLQDTSSGSVRKTSKQLIYVDTVSLLIPTGQGTAKTSEAVAAPTNPPSRSFTPHGMPGTFSIYSDMSKSRREGSGSIVWSPHETSLSSDRKAPLAVDIGAVRCQLDISCGRLLYRLGSKCMSVLKIPEANESQEKSSAAVQRKNDIALELSVREISLAFKESVGHSVQNEVSANTFADSAITIVCQNLDFDSDPHEKTVRIGSFTTYLGSSCLLSFDRIRDVRSSMIISEQTPDIALAVTSKRSATRRDINEITVETLAVDVLLDLPAIDEAFGSFGGLSGVLEVGNSILSESGLVSAPSSPSKPAKGVRFEGDPQLIGTPEIKVNGRIGGVSALLQGSACNVQLRTTTVKAVYREQGAVATIENVMLSGPHTAEDPVPPMSIDLATLRVEYLLSPQDKDLERLLSLLTPSKDKYDTDDDILIDTLLRQRRKGAVARLSVSDFKLKCQDLGFISNLSALGEELGKLSVVTKYLPEDERPGLLTLVRVKDCEARLPVNDRFGKTHVNVSDFHCAHVGLPALLALSIGDIKASQNGELELVHSLVPLSGSDNLPMVMARMLGDEAEPIVKVKLFNICVEYSVPALLDLTNMDKEADTEEIVAELAKSVANLTLPDRHGRGSAAGPTSDTTGTSTKKLKLDLLLHDAAVGLTPQKLSSKGLLVLSDAYVSSTIPPEDILTALIELRKAGLFIADHVNAEDIGAALPLRGSPSNTAVRPRLTSALAKQGFVSVGSMMAAKISVRVEDSADSKAKSVDVAVKNELLLLETCADSTQTLTATLNGLAPPTPPSKQPKYLTEPMTIEDMMASFTGDAYAKPQPPPERLVDVEEEPGDDNDSMLAASMFVDEDDDVLAQSDTTSSLYGPVSGVLQGVDKPEDDDASEEFPETVESLLEDDPFEMPISPTDEKLSDAALVREISRQCKPSTSGEPVDLGLYEIDDLGFDALGGNQRALGTQHRFNTPLTGRSRRTPASTRHQALPFKLKLRGLHIIWNIYDGYDWQRTRDGITEAVEQVEVRAEQRKAKRRQSANEREDEESVIGDFLFNSIYIGVPSNHDAQELRRQINRNIDDMASETESVPMSGISRPTAYSASGRPLRQNKRRRLKLERSKVHKVAFELKGVSADILGFPPDSADIVSSVDVRIRDFEIFDNVPTSTWRKFLTHLDSDPSTREMSKPMVHIELLNVRTLENFAASEIVMHVSVLPLRLHVDQDALDFITRFFEFKDDSVVPSDPGEQPFLQRVEVDTVDMRLDYKPKKVDYAGIRSGHTNEFMNFIILDAADIRLKHAIIYGIKGFEPLHKTLNDIWMPDVTRNQLPTVLAGLAPVRSLVNIGMGVRDVVAIPVREYKKDGRIVRSIQKGAFQFGKTTASELARLGAKVAIGTHTLLQGAEGYLSPTSAFPSGRPSSGRRVSDQGWHDVDEEDEEPEQRAISAYANQPLGVFAGLRSARRYLEHDLLTARDALIAVQGEVLESSTPGSAAAAVARHAPTVILRPIIGASRAVGTSLLGVGNQIDRGNVRRVEDKYKKR